MLNGREYGKEISTFDEREAEDSGLVVLFGYSDDNAEFRGAINDEVGCYDGGVITIDEEGVAPNWDDKHEEKNYEDAKEYFRRKGLKQRQIGAIWGKDGYSWQYRTDLPHATFEIVEGSDKYCRGIVFAVADL